MIEDSNITEEDVKAQETKKERLRTALASFVDSDGFKIYKEIVNGQISARKLEIDAIDVIDNATMVKVAKLKGEISGMETVIALPNKALLQIQEDELMKKYNKGEDNGNR